MLVSHQSWGTKRNKEHQASYHRRDEGRCHEDRDYDEHDERQLPADEEPLDEGEDETGEQLDGTWEFFSQTVDDFVHITADSACQQ